MAEIIGTEMLNRKPIIGQRVYYMSYGSPIAENGYQAFPSVFRAAIITQIVDDDDTVGLLIMNPTGIFFHGACIHDETRTPGTWHYMPGPLDYVGVG